MAASAAGDAVGGMAGDAMCSVLESVIPFGLGAVASFAIKQGAKHSAKQRAGGK